MMIVRGIDAARTMVMKEEIMEMTGRNLDVAELLELLPPVRPRNFSLLSFFSFPPHVQMTRYILLTPKKPWSQFVTRMLKTRGQMEGLAVLNEAWSIKYGFAQTP